MWSALSVTSSGNPMLMSRTVTPSWHAFFKVNVTQPCHTNIQLPFHRKSYSNSVCFLSATNFIRQSRLWNREKGSWRTCIISGNLTRPSARKSNYKFLAQETKNTTEWLWPTRFNLISNTPTIVYTIVPPTGLSDAHPHIIFFHSFSQIPLEVTVTQWWSPVSVQRTVISKRL